MPQISLYIDEATLKKVASAAARQQVSISKWVGDQIRAKVDPVYPRDYERLFGSVDDSFVNPGQPDGQTDTPRESF